MVDVVEAPLDVPLDEPAETSFEFLPIESGILCRVTRRTAAPDLAVEVVSPNDTAAAVDGKVKEYFDAGTRLVWVVYPGTRSVTVHRSPSDATTLKEGDTLDGEPIFKDFHVPVSELFG